MPFWLRGNIIRNLRLVEVGTPSLAVPTGLKPLKMFDKESVRGNVVAVNGEAIVAGVDGPARPSRLEAVIGAPEPDVVHDHIVRVDSDAVLCCGYRCRATDTAGNVEERGGVCAVICVAAMGSHDEEGGRRPV